MLSRRSALGGGATSGSVRYCPACGFTPGGGRRPGATAARRCSIFVDAKEVPARRRAYPLDRLETPWGGVVEFNGTRSVVHRSVVRPLPGCKALARSLARFSMNSGYMVAP